MKKLIVFLTLICCFTLSFINSAQAQNHGIVIKGIVVDESEEPLIGATVLFTGTQIGTITGLGGDFSLYIDVPSGITVVSSLTVSFIGYQTAVVPLYGVGGVLTNMKIQLEEDNQLLDDEVI